MLDCSWNKIYRRSLQSTRAAPRPSPCTLHDTCARDSPLNHCSSARAEGWTDAPVLAALTLNHRIFVTVVLLTDTVKFLIRTAGLRRVQGTRIIGADGRCTRKPCTPNRPLSCTLAWESSLSPPLLTKHPGQHLATCKNHISLRSARVNIGVGYAP